MATKLFLPQERSGLVRRPRLLERMERGAGTTLTLVSAPPGFGKSTLLAEWLRAEPGSPRRTAWLSLDPGDDDPATFWGYVAAAFATAVPGLGSSVLDLVAAVPLDTPLVLTTLVNELADTPGEVWLVLDDFHVVDSPAVTDGLAFLLEHLPPQVHVVVSTRADPALPLSRWRVRGELVEVRAADLRFTPAETAAYLTQASGVHLTAEDVELLEERTEGWIAALQLAALSIQGRDDASGFIARFAGDDRYVLDYLVDEVLGHQPEPVREFLLQSSVLDRLTGPLCDAVTGREDGSSALVALEQANLFLVALDDRREWYRYHRLFADALRARLLAEKPATVPLLHQRASRWYEARCWWAEAVRHALAASDVDRAAHLMELALPTIRRHRQEATLLSWLEALPERTIRCSPVLSVFYGHARLVSGELDAVEPWLDEAERLLAATPPPPAAEQWAPTSELRSLPATISVYRAALAQARGDVAGTSRHARRALVLAGPDDHLARGGAAGFLGLAAWAEGEVTEALETFGRAVSSLHAAGSSVDELSSMVVLADLWLVAGRPSTARRLYERALGQADLHGDRVAGAAAGLHVGLAEIDAEVGDLTSARRHLEASAALVDPTSPDRSHSRWFVAMARVTRADGDVEGAVTLLDQAQQHDRPGFLPDIRPLAALRARALIVGGRLEEAAAWARARGVSTSEDARYLREFDHLTLVRLLLAQHRAHPRRTALAPAVALLERLLRAATDSARAGSALEIRLLQALAHDAQGDRDSALACLARAWTEAPEPDGYLRLFLDEGTPMLDLLGTAVQRDAVQHAEVVREQARRMLASGAPAGSRITRSGGSVRSAPVEALSPRELDVLRLLDSELTGPQIARQLFVSQNTLRTHTKHIFTKLGVTNRRSAVIRARERGLV